MAPTVAPAAMKPNSRLPCSELNRSTIIAQNTDTTNRLNTDVQTKKTRPIQTNDCGPDQCSATANSSRFAAKNRYVIGMKRLRGKFRTSQP